MANSFPHDENRSRARDRTSAGGNACLIRLFAVLVLVGSLGLGTWNLVVNSPWSEPVTRPATAAESHVPHTAVNPYSVNTFLSQEVEPWKREKTVEMISLAGIGWIKEGFPWSEIEPAPDSYWDSKYQQDSWRKFDEIVSLAEEYGLRVIARLDHAPEWAVDEDSEYPAPPVDVEDYGDFVETFVERYKGRVQHIQIWNEPNLAREWGGEIDPDGYLELLREAYASAKSVDPDIVVLGAPMAMTNEDSDRAVPEFDYWEELYSQGAGDYFDVMTATGYGIDQPPEDPPESGEINLRRIEFLRDIMERHGDDDKPVWLTEYGWNASSDSVPQDRLQWGRVTDEQQAEWTARGVEWMSENWDWFGVSSIWYFRQVGLIPPDAPEYYFAMVDLEFTPRQVYLEVKDDALERTLALPGRYGPMESPVQTTGQWPRSSAPDAQFGESIRSTQEGAQIQVNFSGTDLSLLLDRNQPTHGRIYVELNNETAQSEVLETDDRGRTYLDLDRLDTDQTSAPIVEDFESEKPQHEHEATLTLGPDSAVSIAGVEVDYQRSYGQFTLLAAFSVVGIVLAGMVLRR